MIRCVVRAKKSLCFVTVKFLLLYIFHVLEFDLNNKSLDIKTNPASELKVCVLQANRVDTVVNAFSNDSSAEINLLKKNLEQ